MEGFEDLLATFKTADVDAVKSLIQSNIDHMVSHMDMAISRHGHIQTQ